MREQLTEQQVADLSGLCRIEIRRWKSASESNPNMRYMVDLMELALASLEADVHSYTFEEDPQPLYTAPPVPVLRFPKSQVDSCGNEWVLKKEVRRINAGAQVVKPQQPAAYRWESVTDGRMCYDGIKPTGVKSQPLYLHPQNGGEVAE